jgi:hypothetical protein
MPHLRNFLLDGVSIPAVIFETSRNFSGRIIQHSTNAVRFISECKQNIQKVIVDDCFNLVTENALVLLSQYGIKLTKSH